MNIELPPEFKNVDAVLANGAVKHGTNSWLKPGVFSFGPRLQSIFRHTLKVSGLWKSTDLRVSTAINIVLEELKKAEFKNENLLDDESGLSHMLHGQCNFAMFHTLISRGILQSNIPELSEVGKLIFNGGRKDV